MKLFRKFRRATLADSRMGQYLLYATGEIVLVVVGILIALAINNANERRQARDRQQTYLSGLRTEFETNRRKLAELMSVNRENYLGAQRLADYMADTTLRPTPAEVDKLLFDTFSREVAYHPNNSLLQEMTNSGNLKDVSDRELRLGLTSWASTMEGLGNQERELRLQREKILDILRTDRTDVRTVFERAGVVDATVSPNHPRQAHNLGLLRSRSFENNVLMFVLTSRITEESVYAPLMGEIDFILGRLPATEGQAQNH